LEIVAFGKNIHDGNFVDNVDNVDKPVDEHEQTFGKSLGIP
jgi:hypothetical protein